MLFEAFSACVIQDLIKFKVYQVLTDNLLIRGLLSQRYERGILQSLLDYAVKSWPVSKSDPAMCTSNPRGGDQRTDLVQDKLRIFLSPF